MKHEMQDAKPASLEDMEPSDREALAGVLADLNLSAIKRGAPALWTVADPAGPATERGPTADEAMGMAWWNNLSEADRARWASKAGTGVVADAWAAFKASQRG